MRPTRCRRSTRVSRRSRATQPYPLLFATVSGAHLYGFPSPDSDWDLRGVHVLPPTELLGSQGGSRHADDRGEARGFRARSGHPRREEVLRPDAAPERLRPRAALFAAHRSDDAGTRELKAIARGCVTRHHNHHYLGFAQTQWDLFVKESPRRVKPLLYVYRVLLTGIHLMRTGEIEANIVRLNEDGPPPQIPDLVARKLAGPEKGDARRRGHRVPRTARSLGSVDARRGGDRQRARGRANGPRSAARSPLAHPPRRTLAGMERVETLSAH